MPKSKIYHPYKRGTGSLCDDRRGEEVPEKAVVDGKVSEAVGVCEKAAKEAEANSVNGMALSVSGVEGAQDAFKESMLGRKKRAKDDYTYLLTADMSRFGQATSNPEQ